MLNFAITDTSDLSPIIMTSKLQAVESPKLITLRHVTGVSVQSSDAITKIEDGELSFAYEFSKCSLAWIDYYINSQSEVKSIATVLPADSPRAHLPYLKQGDVFLINAVIEAGGFFTVKIFQN